MSHISSVGLGYGILALSGETRDDRSKPIVGIAMGVLLSIPC
jgi:hypothetical protein